MDFGQLLSNFAETAGSVYGTVAGRKTIPASQPATPTPTAPNWSKYLPWAIGAVVVVVIIALVTRKG